LGLFPPTRALEFEERLALAQASALAALSLASPNLESRPPVALSRGGSFDETSRVAACVAACMAACVVATASKRLDGGNCHSASSCWLEAPRAQPGSRPLAESLLPGSLRAIPQSTAAADAAARSLSRKARWSHQVSRSRRLRADSRQQYLCFDKKRKEKKKRETSLASFMMDRWSPFLRGLKQAPLTVNSRSVAKVTENMTATPQKTVPDKAENQGLNSPTFDPIDRYLPEGMTKGVIFVAFTDKKGYDSILSSKNYVDGELQFKNAMCDSGYAGTLLSFFDSQSIVAFFRLYSKNRAFVISVEEAVGAHGDGLVLVAEHVAMQGYFSLNIGTDMFPNARPGRLRRLRFHLSSENAQFIVENYIDHISQEDRAKLETHQHAKIRGHGMSLIGNVFCSQFTEVKQSKARYFLDARECPSIDFNELTNLSNRLRTSLLTKAQTEMLNFGEFVDDPGDY
jgi:hypothetical protein